MTRAPKVANCSETEIIRQLQERVSILDDRCTYLEGSKKAEYDARIKAVEQVGQLKETAQRADREALVARDQRADMLRQLAFAQGYIAALKGDPYPATEIHKTGHAPSLIIGGLR